MDRTGDPCEHRRMTSANGVAPVVGDHLFDDALAAWPAAADAILRAGLWCVIERGDEAAPTGWDPRLIICSTEPGDIAEAIARRVATVPSRSERIAGYTRDTLVRVESAPTALCYVAEPLAESA
jgi:hypothetical protein